MKTTGLICLLLAALPLAAAARSRHHEITPKRAFRMENPCPATGVIEPRGCPGWTIGYFTPLCAGGIQAKENMYWITVENAQAIRSTVGKGCKNVMDRVPSRTHPK